MQDSLQRLVSSWREIPPPIDVHSCIVGEVVQLYDQSVWTLRNIVRGLEKVISRPRQGISAVVDIDIPTQSRDAGFAKEPNFPFLHDIARHVIHSTETLEVAISTVVQMAEKVKRVEASGQGLSQHRLDLHRQTLSNLHACSQALDVRLHNEISLVSHNRLA